MFSILIYHFVFLSRQLGHRGGPSKLVPLVQGLAHQVNLFLVEYNKYNQQINTNLQSLNLPGYKPKQSLTPSPVTSGLGEIPEGVLHQQRLLLQNCDRLKLTVSRHQLQSGNSHHGKNMGEVVEVITQLGANFTKLIELMLSKEIKVSQNYE